MLLALLNLACTQDSTFYQQPDIPPPAPGYGEITGRVCDPDGVDWLEGALVYMNLVDSSGRYYDLKSDLTELDGSWILEEVPAGYDYQVMIQYGDEIIETHEVDVTDNRRTEIPEPECFDTRIQDIAVVSGDFDDYDTVLDALEIPSYQEINGQVGEELMDFLMDLQAMKEFDLIIFNGGHLEEGIFYNSENPHDTIPAQILSNLRTYVQDGGNIYASDWSYDVIELAWPENIDFLGTDHVPDDAQKGVVQTVSASVANQVMGEFLEDGDGFLTIQYDLPVWPVVERVSDTTSIHLMGEVEYRDGEQVLLMASSPLLLSFNGGGGKVVFSSFRFAANLNESTLQVMQYVMFEL